MFEKILEGWNKLPPFTKAAIIGGSAFATTLAVETLLTKEVRESIAKWWRSLAPTERMVIFSLLSFLSYTATLLAFHSLVGVET